MNVTIQKQQGAALFVALVFLAILMVLGVTAVRNSSFQEKMATNVHQQNWAFGAADAGVNAFNTLANEGDDRSDSQHILFRARINGSVNFCVDEKGAEGACDSTFLDGTQKLTKAEVDVNKEGCFQKLCTGFSLSADPRSGIQCIVYKVDGTGNAVGVEEEVEWWAFQIGARC
ncbi:PilX N-terminal domain-containing pilus assembly protein [Pleionea sp. CnH1-48]|uniref:pilus assembly PilX family protein n=1 Tax=Pleionea sp. CnH1-48 TaxID=2954494 RepID=UPI002097C8D5|nr:PilX N-terminal domain-containing pilus assembly protein [Pleionea sp. CnH1-48]MCO7222870.1 pilus assembly PilX N-terminal domain-containing protein [Pleionea sp. CnH1-48]